MYNGNCFVVEMESVTWFEARDICMEKGGHLAEICDADLNAEILQLYQNLGLGWNYVFFCILHKLF